MSKIMHGIARNRVVGWGLNTFGRALNAVKIPYAAGLSRAIATVRRSKDNVEILQAARVLERYRFKRSRAENALTLHSGKIGRADAAIHGLAAFADSSGAKTKRGTMIDPEAAGPGPVKKGTLIDREYRGAGGTMIDPGADLHRGLFGRKKRGNK